jgi:GH15 family glucan-1,4-alpha-glucosidase
VLARAGEAHVAVRLGVRAGFSEEPLVELRREDAGVWQGRSGEVRFRWAGGDRAAVARDERGNTELRLDLHLEEGGRHDLTLVLALDERDLELPDVDATWSATEQAWRERVPDLELDVARRDARHAVAVLTGLTSRGGGLVAAATASLPERARQGRNYDYRYVWIRDLCYAGQAAAAAGVSGLLDSAVGFVRDRLLEHGAELQPAYTTHGGRVPDEREVDLPGYPGARNVVGNSVSEQFQLDVFGEALLLFAAAARRDQVDAATWRAAESAAAAIEARGREPDAGIWELEPREWTHSRLMCAAGLRAIADARPGDEASARRLALADDLVADAAARGLHSSGRWQRAPDDERVDAALLLPAIRGAIPVDDPRSVATLRAVLAELTCDGYAYRFRPDERPLGEAEGAFLLCGFLLALAHAQQGDAVSSARWFERNRTACGPPGLLSEEFDVTQRQLRGNLPQAFVHALLLECAVAQETVAEPSS